MDVTRNERELRELYARWLDRATRIGFIVSVAAFAVYASGLLPAYVPPAELPRYWALPVDRFVALTGAAQHWAWLRHLGHSDVLNLAALALLALVTPACYARVVPKLAAQRDWLQLSLACAQLVVLLLAASGLLAGAG